MATSQPPAPTLDYLFQVVVTLDPALEVGETPAGRRRIIPITGGTTTGRVQGAILDGGADYQLSGSLDAWYTLAPDNGEFILVRNCGASGGLIPWFEETAGLGWLASFLSNEWVVPILALVAIGCIASLLAKFARRNLESAS